MAPPGKDIYYITEKLCAFYDYVGSVRLPIISACKSVIVSAYTPVLLGTQSSPVLNLVHVLVFRICLTSEHDCILHLYLYRSGRVVTMMIPG